MRGFCCNTNYTDETLALEIAAANINWNINITLIRTLIILEHETRGQNEICRRPTDHREVTDACAGVWKVN